MPRSAPHAEELPRRAAAPAPRGIQAFLMYTGVTEGGIAASMVLGTYALLGLPPSGPLVALAFCGTLLVYQFDRVAGTAPEDAFNQPDRRAWLRRHRWFAGGPSVAAAVVSAALLPFLRLDTLLVGCVLSSIAVCYALPLLPGGRRLKAVWWAKPVAVAGAWAVGATVLPALEAGASVTGPVAALAAYRFLFVVPNVVLADAADRTGDARAGLRTVATEWPLRRLRWFSAVALAGAVTGAGGAVFLLGAPWLLLVDAAGPALLLAAAWRAPVSAAPSAASFYGLRIDLVMAWPLVTAGAAWLSPLGP